MPDKSLVCRTLSRACAAAFESLEARRLLSDVNFLPAADVTAPAPDALAVADLNGDNSNDIVATDFQMTGNVSVLINKGDGTFNTAVEYATGSFPEGVAIGKLNGDSALDLVTANNDDNDVSVLLGNGNGTFQPQHTFAVGSRPSDVAIGDFNNDEVNDLVTSNEDDGTVSVLIGNGDGSFQTQKKFAVGGHPTLVAVANLKNANQDIITANDEGTISILKGNGNDTFAAPQTITIGPQPSGLAVGDLNNDGFPDLVVSSFQGDTVSVLLNKGDGTFAAPVNYTVGSNPATVAVGDTNADNIPDIAVANESNNSLGVLLGKGNGTFQPEVDFPSQGFPYEVAIADVTGDNRPDLISANEVSLSMLQNEPVFAAPALKEPAAHAKNQSNVPTFAWSAVSGGYRLVVSTDPAALPTVASDTGGVVGTGFDVEPPMTSFTDRDADLQHGTKYYWEVQGLNGTEVGSWSAIRSFTTAPDVAPVVKHLAAASILKDTTYTATGAFTDPDVSDTWTATVNYGDGSGKHTLTLNSAKHFTLSHGYSADGKFTVSVVVKDNSGEAGTATTTVTVTGAGAGAVRAAVPMSTATSAAMGSSNLSTIQVLSDAERLKKLLN